MIVEKQPRADSALVREIEGNESHQWDLDAHLLAGILDSLNSANWQRGGGRGRRPQPVPRPGVTEVEKKVVGKKAVSIEELDAFLSARSIPDPAPPPDLRNQATNWLRSKRKAPPQDASNL